MTKDNSNFKKTEINLNDIFHKLLDAKILVIFITFLSVAFSIYISKNSPVLFKSSALIEIGQFVSINLDDSSSDGLINYKKLPIEETEDFVRALRIHFNYTKNQDIDIFARDSNIVQIDTENLEGVGTPLLNEVLEYSRNRHKTIADSYTSQMIKIMETEIENLNSTIMFNKELLDIEIKSNKGIILEKLNDEIFLTQLSINDLKRQIKSTDSEIRFNKELGDIETQNKISNYENILESLNNKIYLLEEITSKEVAALKLLKSQYSNSLDGNGLDINQTPYFMSSDEQVKMPAFIWFDESIFKRKSKLVDLRVERKTILSDLTRLKQHFSELEVSQGLISAISGEMTLINNSNNPINITNEGRPSLLFNLIQEKIDLVAQLESKLLYFSSLQLSSRDSIMVTSVTSNTSPNIVAEIELKTNEIKFSNNNIPMIIFTLSQEALNKEADLKVFKMQSEFNTETSFVGAITPEQVYSKSLLLMLFAFIFGLILSVTIVFSISAFKNISTR